MSEEPREIDPDLGIIIDNSLSMTDGPAHTADQYRAALDTIELPEGTVIEFTEGDEA